MVTGGGAGGSGTLQALLLDDKAGADKGAGDDGEDETLQVAGVASRHRSGGTAGEGHRSRDRLIIDHLKEEELMEGVDEIWIWRERNPKRETAVLSSFSLWLS